MEVILIMSLFLTTQRYTTCFPNFVLYIKWQVTFYMQSILAAGSINATQPTWSYLVTYVGFISE